MYETVEITQSLYYNLDLFCNGIKHHSATKTCELVHYNMSKQLQTGQENADGWQLWLPGVLF